MSYKVKQPNLSGTSLYALFIRVYRDLGKTYMCVCASESSECECERECECVRESERKRESESESGRVSLSGVCL